MSLMADKRTPRFEVAAESQLRFLLGRCLLRCAASAMALAPPGLSVPQRQALQHRWAGRLLRHLQVDLEIDGAVNLPREPHVVVALHEGMADVLCLLMLGRPMRFVARREIFTMGAIGAAVARLGHLAIDPEQGAASYRALARQAGRVLDDGEDLVIFAQGTLLGIEAALRPGAFHIAQALQRPLLPVALTGTHRIWEHPFSPRLRYQQAVSLRVLPPLPPVPPGREAVERVRQEVQRDLKHAALGAGAAAARRFHPERDGWWDGYSYEIDPAFADLRAAVQARRASGGAAPGARP